MVCLEKEMSCSSFLLFSEIDNMSLVLYYKLYKDLLTVLNAVTLTKPRTKLLLLTPLHFKPIRGFAITILR